MIRPLSLLVIAGALSIAPLAGCGVVPSSDMAARVDDAELTQSDLQTMLDSAPEQAEPADANTIDMNSARELLTVWIVNEAFTAEAGGRGLEVPAFDGDLTDLEGLNQHANDTYTALQTDLQANPPSDDELQAGYDSLSCFQLLQVPDGDAGDDAATRLNAGEAFADVAADFQGGFAQFVGCFPNDTVGAAFANGLQEPAFDDVTTDLTTAEAGEVVGPIIGQSGAWIAQRPRFEDFDDDQRTRLAQDVLLYDTFAKRDIEIASMYGAFSLSGGVVPLGPAQPAPLGG